jgi:hypothetical protein
VNPSTLVRGGVAAALMLLGTVRAQQPTDPQNQAALDRAIAELDRQDPTNPSPIAEAGNVRLLDVSLDALFAFGSSTATDAELAGLKAGGHDPRKRGATIQNVELSLLGAVDPYFNGETHVVWFVDPIDGESRFELEEAFLTTTSLPYGLELRAGQMFTDFGRHNPRHPHAWDWHDQPLTLSRVFGPDGMRGAGARAAWLTPLPWFAELSAGVQNASGETMASFLASDELFEERAVGGRPFVDRRVRSLADLAYSLRLVNSWDLDDEVTAGLGLSALFGPNATGLDTRTGIYGADLQVKWRPAGAFRGSPSLTFEGEFVFRDYEAGAFVDEGDPNVIGDETAFGQDTLHDLGFWAQVLWGFTPRWSAGIRYERASASGGNFDPASVALVGPDGDPFRDDRYRVSPLLVWRLTEYSRVRLQYDYDRADHLAERDAHSAWLGFEVALGKHPAHAF